MYACISVCVQIHTQRERYTCRTPLQGSLGRTNDTWADTVAVTMWKMRTCMTGVFADLQQKLPATLQRFVLKNSLETNSESSDVGICLKTC